MSELNRRLLATDILAWPEPVRALAWQTPWLSVPLEVGDTIAVAEDVPETAPMPLMPKIAIKSWQESGRLRQIPADLPLHDAIRARLATPTVQQRVTLTAWAGAKTPPCLHLLPWTDMSNVSEMRAAWSAGQITLTSQCRRNTVPLDRLDITPVMQMIATEMPAVGSFSVQFAVTADGSAHVLDINPLLSPSETAELSAAIG